jgi:hypothetical protein
VSRGRVVALVVAASAVVAAAIVVRRSHRPVDAPPPLASARIARAPGGAPSCLRVQRRAADAEWRWDVVDVAVDLDRCTLDVARADGGDRLDRLLPAGALAALNGGYFEADFRPTAWLRARGVDLSLVHRTHVGGVLGVRGSSVFVGPLAELPFDPDLAVQSAPLVIESDGAAGIHSDDGKRAARTVACAAADGLHFVLVTAPGGDGPTLMELARWLAGDGGCRVALNLDGGPSTGIVFAPELREPSSLPRAPIGYAIVVQPVHGSR